jgi:hypothetical protein
MQRLRRRLQRLSRVGWVEMEVTPKLLTTEVETRVGGVEKENEVAAALD